jgi:hypothetical protein
LAYSRRPSSLPMKDRIARSASYCSRCGSLR